MEASRRPQHAPSSFPNNGVQSSRLAIGVLRSLPAVPNWAFNSIGVFFLPPTSGQTTIKDAISQWPCSRHAASAERRMFFLLDSRHSCVKACLCTSPRPSNSSLTPSSGSFLPLALAGLGLVPTAVLLRPAVMVAASRISWKSAVMFASSLSERSVSGRRRS